MSAPRSGYPNSPSIRFDAEFPFLPGVHVHLGVLLALIAAILIWWILARTTLGSWACTPSRTRSSTSCCRAATTPTPNAATPCARGFEAVTTRPARIMHLEGYGLDVGCNADMVVLQARDPIEAIRLRARRLVVIRRGTVIAEAPEDRTALSLPGRPEHVGPSDFSPQQRAAAAAGC